jgi:hypothetical protein
MQLKLSACQADLGLARDAGRSLLDLNDDAQK